MKKKNVEGYIPTPSLRPGQIRPCCKRISLLPVTLKLRRTDIRCSLWVMAQSGPEKPVRRSIVGSEQPSEVSWGEHRAPGSDQSVAHGYCAGSWSPAICSIPFRGWDAIHQAFVLVDQPQDLVGAATGVEGICALGPWGVRPAPREGLATCMALPWLWSQRLVDVFSRQIWGCWPLERPLRLASCSGN